MPLKIPYYEMDIPRLVTALADWLPAFCTCGFCLRATAGSSVRRCTAVHWRHWHSTLWPPTALTAGGSMCCTRFLSHLCCFLWRRPPVQTAGRWGISARGRFILAGFAGALTWQMYVYFARYIAALQSLPALVLFIAAGFGIIFGLMWLLEDGGSTGSIQFDIRPRTTCIAAVMAAASTFCPASAIRS